MATNDVGAILALRTMACALAGEIDRQTTLSVSVAIVVVVSVCVCACVCVHQRRRLLVPVCVYLSVRVLAVRIVVWADKKGSGRHLVQQA